MLLKHTFWLFLYTLLLLRISGSTAAETIQVISYDQSTIAANAPLELTFNISFSARADSNSFQVMLPAEYSTSQTLNCSLENYMCTIALESGKPGSKQVSWIITSDLFTSAQESMNVSFAIWNLQNPAVLGSYCGVQVSLLDQNNAIQAQTSEPICLYVNTTTQFHVSSYSLSSKVPYAACDCTITFVTPVELDGTYNLTVVFPSQISFDMQALYSISNHSHWVGIDFISYTLIVIILPLQVDYEGTFSIMLAVKNPWNNADYPFQFALTSSDFQLSDNSSMLYSLANVGTLNISSYNLSSNYLGELANFTIVTNPYVGVGINQSMYVIFNPAFDLSSASCSISMVMLPLISCQLKNSTTFELVKPLTEETSGFPIAFNINGLRNPTSSQISGVFVQAITLNAIFETLENVVIYLNTSFVCRLPCSTCMNQSTYCTSCATGYFLLNHNCLTACPEKYFAANGLCLSCPIDCDKCSMSPYICDTCSDGYNLSSSSHTCEKTVVLSDSNASSSDNTTNLTNSKEPASWLIGGIYLMILLVSLMISLLLNSKRLNSRTIATMVSLMSIAESLERLYILFEYITSATHSPSKTAVLTTSTALFLLTQAVAIPITIFTLCRRNQSVPGRSLKQFYKPILIISASIINYKIMLFAISITARAKMTLEFREKLLALLKKTKTIFWLSCVLSLAYAVELLLFNLKAAPEEKTSSHFIFFGGESFNFLMQVIMLIKLKGILSQEEEHLKSLDSNKRNIADLEGMQCKDFSGLSISNPSSSISIIKDLDVSNELQGITRDQSFADIQIDPQVSARPDKSHDNQTPKGSFTFGKKEKANFSSNKEDIPEFCLTPPFDEDNDVHEENPKDQNQSVNAPDLSATDHSAQQEVPRRRRNISVLFSSPPKKKRKRYQSVCWSDKTKTNKDFSYLGEAEEVAEEGTDNASMNYNPLVFSLDKLVKVSALIDTKLS